MDPTLLVYNNKMKMSYLEVVTQLTILILLGWTYLSEFKYKISQLCANFKWWLPLKK